MIVFVCVHKREARRGGTSEGGKVKRTSVCCNMGGRVDSYFIWTCHTRWPVQSYSCSAEAKNGILPLSLCKHELRCWTMNLRVALLAAGCFSFVCWGRKKQTLFSPDSQFYWFLQKAFQIPHVIPVTVHSSSAVLFALQVWGRRTFTATHVHTNMTEHTFLHV